ncbi:MAG: hypothetical protein J5I59_07575 [Saprospiraceae bacterium]|nr:hypothetical protein [Saprospiraceae bacterium]
MLKKAFICILLILTLLTGCNQGTKKDITGTYVGKIQGKSISMYLDNTHDNIVNGTIFDKNANFIINGKLEENVLHATAVDTLHKVELDVEGTWSKDTLVFMMSLIKPQKSPQPFPVKFLKVFVSTNEKGRQELADLNLLDTTAEKPKVQPEAPVQKVKNSLSMMGLWEIMKQKGSIKVPLHAAKYLFFNADKSISKLEKTLIPLDGYSWASNMDSVVIYYKVDGRIGDERFGIDAYKDNILNLRGAKSELVLKKHVK